MPRRGVELVTGGALKGVLGTQLLSRTEHDVLPAGFRAGPFSTVRVIGKGGSSVVYLGERVDGEFQQQVAIKVSINVAPDRSLVTLERDLLSRLNHPGIVSIHDAGRLEDGRTWLAMDLVDGCAVDKYAERDLPWQRVLALVQSVCDALAHAHRLNVVHRDVKPSNVLVDEEGRMRLLDFGISTDGGSGAPAALMTPGYASPEQLRGEPCGPPSDIYQVGLLIQDLMLDSNEHMRSSRSTVPAVIEDALRRVVGRATRDDPKLRQSSIDEVARDLQLLSRSHPPRSVDVGWFLRWRLFLRRRPLELAASALVVAGVILGGFVFLRERTEHRQLRAEQARSAETGRAFVTGLLRSEQNAGRRDAGPQGMQSLLNRSPAEVLTLLPTRMESRLSAMESLIDAYLDLGTPGARRAIGLVDGLERSEASRSPFSDEHRARIATARARALALLGEREAFLDALAEAERLHRRVSLDESGMPDLKLTRLRILALDSDGKHERAVMEADRAISLAERFGQAGSSDLARIRYYRGLSAWNFGRHHELAERHLHAALDVLDETYGPAYSACVSVAASLAEVLAATGRYDAARALVEPRIDRARLQYGERSSDYANALSAAGSLAVNWGPESDLDRSRERLKIAYDYYMSEDPARVRLRVGMAYAWALAMSERNGEAEIVLADLYEKRASTYGADSPYTLQVQALQAGVACNRDAARTADDLFARVAASPAFDATDANYIEYWALKTLCHARRGESDPGRSLLETYLGASAREQLSSGMRRRLDQLAW